MKYSLTSHFDFYLRRVFQRKRVTHSSTLEMKLIPNYFVVCTLFSLLEKLPGKGMERNIVGTVSFPSVVSYLWYIL